MTEKRKRFDIELPAKRGMIKRLQKGNSVRTYELIRYENQQAKIDDQARNMLDHADNPLKRAVLAHEKAKEFLESKGHETVGPFKSRDINFSYFYKTTYDYLIGHLKLLPSSIEVISAEMLLQFNNMSDPERTLDERLIAAFELGVLDRQFEQLNNLSASRSQASKQERKKGFNDIFYDLIFNPNYEQSAKDLWPIFIGLLDINGFSPREHDNGVSYVNEDTGKGNSLTLESFKSKLSKTRKKYKDHNK